MWTVNISSTDCTWKKVYKNCGRSTLKLFSNLQGVSHSSGKLILQFLNGIPAFVYIFVFKWFLILYSGIYYYLDLHWHVIQRFVFECMCSCCAETFAFFLVYHVLTHFHRNIYTDKATKVRTRALICAIYVWSLAAERDSQSRCTVSVHHFKYWRGIANQGFKTLKRRLYCWLPNLWRHTKQVYCSQVIR